VCNQRSVRADLMAFVVIIHNFRKTEFHPLWQADWLLLADGRLAAHGRGPLPQLDAAVVSLDAGGRHLLPGFIDVHVHGSAGFDTMDAAYDALHGMARFFAQHGTTGFLATTWSDTGERITAALAAALAAIQRPWDDGARLLGVHLEGPYLNPAKCGAQNPAVIRRADPTEYCPWLDTGVIRLVSLAPEYSENLALLRECVARGITVSAAHTDATYEQMQTAIDAGLSHSTHTFNAMRPLGHRDPGVVGAVLSDDRVTCELIPDGIHVHSGAIRVLTAAKPAHGVILITDAMRAAGLPDGPYQIDAGPVTLKDGSIRLADGTLAGSALTYAEGLRRFLGVQGKGLNDSGQFQQAAQVTSLTALGLLKLDSPLTDPAAPADFVVLDDACRVYATIVGGRVVYKAAE